MDELPYRAEYAKSGRANCNGCKTPIDQATLRLAVMVQSPMFDGRTPRWYHHMCFFSKQRPKSAGDIAHLDSLRWEDQEKIRSKIEEVAGKAAVGAVPKVKGKAKKRGAAAAPSAPGDAIKDFFVEYAKSGRAACRGCEEKILKDEVRISKKDFESEESKRYGGLDRWHHLDCFEKLRDELGFWAEGSALPGYKALAAEDKTAVKQKLPKKTPPAKGGDETDGPAAKKVRPEDDEAVRIAKEQNSKLYKLRDQLKVGLKKKELVAMLEHNDQEVPSGQDRILDRLADCMAFGLPAPCDKCGGGQLVFRSGVGYQCQGDLSEWTKCPNVVVQPERLEFRVPEDLAEEHPFLANYKCKPTKRLVTVSQPSSSNGSAAGSSQVDGKSTGPKIHRPPPPLKNMHVVILGNTARDKDDLKAEITKLGGRVVTKIHDKIAFVISTPEEVEKMNKRMQDVKAAEVQVVPEDILDEVKEGEDTYRLITKKSICDWGSDPKKRVPVEDPSKSALSKSKSMYSRSGPSTMKMQLKQGSYVDPDSELQDVAHVLTYKGELYNAVLGLTDIRANKNSYYKLQVLEADGGNRYWLFRAWGRIGTTVGGTKVESKGSAKDAVNAFKELYAEKTGNAWELRSCFEKVPGKMYPVDVDYSANDETPAATKSEVVCGLEKPVQDLMAMLFDVDAMKKTMMEFELDLEKMPLGKISQKQMTQAYKLLSQMQSGIASAKTSDTKLLDLSNRFYTLVPHSFGIEVPPVIKSEEQIKEKMDMVDNMMEIEIAYKMLKTPTDAGIHPVEFHYRQLKAEISVLDRTTYEFEVIEKYVRNTHAATHTQFELEIVDVFKVAREGEATRFKGFKRLPNRKLLWHGSRATNFAGILSQGLRIAPPEAPVTGYMFGKGIYFADMVSKSANYCCTSKTNPTGLLLLCDVALGAMYELTQAAALKRAPDGFFSAKGIGRTEPEPSHTVKLDSGVEVPLGTPVEKTTVQTSLLYNEYIVYDVGQVHIQYLLKMNFKHKF